MTEYRSRREEVEENAERAMARLPRIQVALIFSILAQAIAVIWWASGLTKQMEFVSHQATKLEFKFDQLSAGMPTSRDMNQINDRIIDHEARLRGVERRLGGK